jgi:hypothetical protein
MEYNVEIGFGAVINISGFIKFVQSFKSWLEVTQTHREHGDRISLFLFFQNNGSRLKVWRC